MRIATETAAVDVGIGERLRGLRDGLAFQTFVQNILDGSPSGACVRQRPFTRGFQPDVTHLAAKPDDALRTTQIDEHLRVEERQNQRMAGRTDSLGLRQTLRISANVTADFGNVTDSAGLGVARC
jgi:hypothetical protein